MPVAGHTVHVGWFADEQDPHKLILLSYTTGRWDLLVIPPESDAAAAARLMAAVPPRPEVQERLRHGGAGGRLSWLR